MNHDHDTTRKIGEPIIRALYQISPASRRDARIEVCPALYESVVYLRPAVSMTVGLWLGGFCGEVRANDDLVPGGFRIVLEGRIQS